jgi:predicted kinase
VNALDIAPGTLVVTVGASGSGKSTFLRRVPREAVVSSDAVRHELHGDASSHGNEPRVWRTVYERVHERLGRGLTTVLDSTAASGKARKRAREAARLHGAPLLFLVFDTPLGVSLARNRARQDGLRSVAVPAPAIYKQHAQVQQFLQNPQLDAGQQLVVLSPEEADHLEVRMPLEPAPSRDPIEAPPLLE